MTPDRLHDAITLLPEELLTPVDALRQKKRFHWQPLAALAACLCLAVGLWLLPISAANEKSNGSILDPEEGRGDGYAGSITDQVVEESTSGTFLIATVTEVTEDYLIVQGKDAEPMQIQRDAIEECPAISPGQTIRIFYRDATPPVPYRIEIVNE